MNLTDRSFWNQRGFLMVALVLVTLSYLPDGLILWDQWALVLANSSSYSWVGLFLIVFAGLRYLYPMMGLGVLIGMLFDISFFKRVLFVMMAAIVAILMNSVRIFLTGVVADMTDLGVSEGFFHLFEGWIFFIVTFSLTLFLCWMLLKKKEWNSMGGGYFSVGNIAPDVSPKSGYQPAVATILVVLLVSLALFSRDSEIRVPERSSFISFPLKIDGRIAKRQQLTRIEQDVLKMTDYFLGNYFTAETPPISLFIGYFEAQSKGQTPHSPRVCIPGGGWKITSMQTVNLPIDGRQIPINRVLIAKGKFKQLVYYWFQQSGKSYASSYLAKINTLWRGIVSSRTDGALVRLVMPLGEDVSEKIADTQLTQFAKKAMVIMPKFVPE